MAYNTKPIVTDKDGNPISQYYNSATDKYEPVEGSGGANKVIVYKSDGTESNISLLPILDKLSELTGTVIDEETRKSNELQRIALYDLIFQMLQDGELKGEQGIQGIQGEIGKGLEFHWRGTELGVRVEGDTDYIYVDLKGDSGSIDNLNADDIEGALGFIPFNPADVVNNLTETITGKALDATQGKILDDKIKTHEADNVSAHGIDLKADKAWGTTYQAVLQTGWTGSLEYSKNDLGEVWIRGAITAGTVAVGTLICTLNNSFNPPQNTAINAYNVGTANVVNNNFMISISAELFVRNSTGLTTGNGIRINFIYKV